MNHSDVVSSPVILEAVNLSGRYGLRRIFSRLEFSLSTGQCLVVVGPNGAGKSTLLRILAGLVRPSSGSIALTLRGGSPLFIGSQEGDPAVWSRSIGLSSPDVELYGELSAIENLQFFARVRGIKLDRSTVLQALAAVGLEGRADEYVAAYSTGMRQRLRLLYAIQHSPPVLLLDEAGSNLDDAGRALVARIIAEQLETGIVVLATNDPLEIGFGHQVLTLGTNTV